MKSFAQTITQQAKAVVYTTTTTTTKQQQQQREANQTRGCDYFANKRLSVLTVDGNDGNCTVCVTFFPIVHHASIRAFVYSPDVIDAKGITMLYYAAILSVPRDVG